jgi:alpha-L-rhamnosidase
VKLKIKGKEGQQIRVNYLATYNNGDAKSGKAVATDEYTCKSSNTIEWEPAFSYHVFRYIEVSGENIDKNDIIARMAYPDIDQTGRFACSNDLINSIYKNIVRSGRNSMTGLLTALPDEDAAKASPVSLSSFAATSLYTFNMDKAYDKYMIDLYNFQAPNGKIQIFTKNGANSPGWPEVVVELPWQTYLFTGNSRLLNKSHKTMLAWHQSEMRESDAQAPPYMHDMDGVGDLYELDTTRIRPIGTCYYFYSTTLMGKIEEALGKSDDAISFSELAGFTKDQFNQSYLKYRLARYWSGTQTAHILPLAVGLTPMSHGQRVADFIAANIKQRGIHPTTGILTTRFLLPILSEYNHHDLAYKLITQTTKPSWGYMVKRGSSTIWGNWDGMDDASKYQLALASAGEWLYGYLAGIKPDEKNPGFKHSLICPVPVGDLKWAEASLNTSYGILSVHWEMNDKTFEVNTEIPSNTWSTVSLPVKNTKTARITVNDDLILENSKATKSCPESIKFKGFDSKYAVFEVGSGKYKFVVE